MTAVSESWDTHDLPACHGAAEPVVKPRRPEHRIVAWGKALIVQLGAVVVSLDVRYYLPGILVRGQVSPDQLILPDRLGPGQLDDAIEWPFDRDASQRGCDVIRYDGLHQGRWKADRLPVGGRL